MSASHSLTAQGYQPPATPQVHTMMHTYASAPPAPQPGYMGVPGAHDYAALGQPGPSAHAGLYAHDSIRLYPSLLHLAHIRMQAPKQASWVAF